MNKVSNSLISVDAANRQLFIAVLCGVVFVGDMLAKMGVAIWVFYLIPVALCTSQPRVGMPYLVAVVSSVLIVLDYLLSTPTGYADVAAVNRGFAIISLLGTSYLASRVIAERNRAAHVLWIEQGRTEVSRAIMGDLSVKAASDQMASALAAYLKADVALLYRLQGAMLSPAGGYAIDAATRPACSAAEGAVSEVIRSRKALLLSDLAPDHLRITSLLGSSAPASVLIVPLLAEGHVQGVLELGFAAARADLDASLELGQLVGDKLGMALRSALYREHLQELLEETRRQSEELQTQQEELRVTNEELQEQARLLQESQSMLEVQQNELEHANVTLEERTQLLEQQKAALERTERQLTANAAELGRANRYKSEFLANMSHELRTPLNSSLILSHMLVENKPGSLTADQLRYARTIHAANQDLLTLINDILDLSKIEAGQIEVELGEVGLTDLLAELQRTFEPVAQERALAFELVLDPALAPALHSDAQRLQQILRNLLSNAFKFTTKGKVRLDVAPASIGRLRFSVTDTGIGIPADKQALIFEAFRQADGSTSRTYGGTGLGLSISRHLAQLLGGVLSVQSVPGAGSVFTLDLPLVAPAPATAQMQVEQGDPVAAVTVDNDPASTWTPDRAGFDRTAPNVRTQGGKDPDRRAQDGPAQAVGAPDAAGPGSATGPGPGVAGTATRAVAAAPAHDPAVRPSGRSILIVEDDVTFAEVLCELVLDMGFTCLHAASGAEAIRMVETAHPDALLLDVGLPDQSGLTVLAHVKRHPATRHIPVHMISVDDYRHVALELGAVGYAVKPAARDEVIGAIRKIETYLSAQVRHILVVEDDPGLRTSLAEMLAGPDVAITTAGNVTEALAELEERTFDCMVMDLMLPDQSGYELLETLTRSGRHGFPPVIVYTGRVLSRDEEQRLRKYAQSIIIKGAKSPERLLDEVSLFLHRIESDLPEHQRRVLAEVRQRDQMFEQRTILLVEDDVRNVFALSSLFEPLGVKLEIARNGREALERVAGGTPIDLVLMDLMMPEMDGLSAIREIRKDPRHRDLPIIALTAKAMVNDRRESIEAGANDYIAKPIDVEKLISLCRVWLSK